MYLKCIYCNLYHNLFRFQEYVKELFWGWLGIVDPTFGSIQVGGDNLPLGTNGLTWQKDDYKMIDGG